MSRHVYTTPRGNVFAYGGDGKVSHPVSMFLYPLMRTKPYVYTFEKSFTKKNYQQHTHLFPWEFLE